MENKKGYLVKFETTQQVGPDEYRSIWMEKVFNEGAPLSDVYTWIDGKLGSIITQYPTILISKPE